MDHNTFLEGRILPPLIRFSIPLMLSLILQALYGGVDLAVVGHFSATSSVSAVATGSQVMQSATALVTGLNMGVTVLLGQAIGAGDRRRAGGVIAGQIRLFLPLALLLTVVMVAFAPQAAQLMNVPQEAVAETIRYVRICACGMIFITAYNAISGVFRGIGDSRSPFLFVAIACGMNVVLDLLFVGVFGMAASGAALATVIAQGASVLFSAAYIRRRPLPFDVDRESFRLPQTSRSILRLGTPIALQDVLVNISFLIITSIVNSLGLVASASVGVAEKMFVFLSIVPMAFLSTLSAFVAQNIGAGNHPRATKALFAAQSISFAFGTVMFLLTFFQGGLLASLFTSDPAVIAATAQYLRGCSFEYLMISLSFCFLGYFNGLGRTTFVMLQGLLSAFLVRIPLSIFFSRLPDTNMGIISLAVPISALSSLVMCLCYFFWLRRSLKHTH
ncbi:MATE family efflux transporter [Angelakisella massiliensis]|uniref:MATE family efflux transporter n=1 Tax=Angelakisella massiliensis TaxID=1871018 RepID=UPI0008F8CC22|nr:MATE family efflux transporter [Angelakisella massiliensis]